MKRTQVQRQSKAVLPAAQRSNRRALGKTAGTSQVANDVSLTLGPNPAQLMQNSLRNRMQQSSQVATQLKRSAGIKPKADQALVQLLAVTQKAGNDELLQEKSDIAQRAEEEEMLQGKFDVSQRVEEEELMQGKFDVSQQVEDEEMLQGKFDTAQLMEEEEPMQGKAAQLQEQKDAAKNNTGMPDSLKSGIESLSGMSMDAVKVHYNSDKPAQMNALAYAQGNDIHVGPGQEKHLPHEAWHVVQQAQGRVKPTTQAANGTQVNDDKSLENEADVMGAKAMQQKKKENTSTKN